MLSFPEEQTDYYNPERPQQISGDHFYGANKIEGPTTLCPGDFGTYQLSSTYNGSTVQNIIWSASSNINIPSPNSHPTTVQAVSVKTPTWIEASFEELRSVPQYHNGELVAPPPLAFVPVEDVCAFTYRKPLLSEVRNYWIEKNVVPCEFKYVVKARIAIGVPEPPLSEDDFTWTAVNNTNGLSMTGTGRVFDFEDIIPIPGQQPCATITIRLQVHNDCGDDLIRTETINCSPCLGLPPQVVITPNPANNQVSIRIAQNQNQDFISADPNGVRIRIYPSNGGSTILLDSYLYNNGQYFNVGSLPNGIYQVRATASDLTPIQANLSIVR
jgi:hypothetical protein